jgi:nucleoside phosphorylase
MGYTTKDWLQINLGIAPTSPPPASAFAVTRPSTPDDFALERILYDSEGPEGQAFEAFAVGSTGLSKFLDIPWPKDLAPKPARKLASKPSDPLPAADVLVVTWTVDEAHALSRVLTPGFDSKNNWKAYTHEYAQIAKAMRAGCPARNAKRLGSYWTTTIGGKKVVCFKSESHLSQDGPPHPKKISPTLANFLLWKQIISEVRPKLVLTTGTGGGIGKDWEVGDVIVSPIVRFATKSPRRSKPNVDPTITGPTKAKSSRFKQARDLFKANATHLPKTNTRKIPEISVSKTPSTSIVTTNFFGFDTSENTYGLRGTGSLSEMGDIVLAAVAETMGGRAFQWLAVRNVSDPQISDPGKSTSQEAKEAATIYKAYGKWSSVCSAIVCWALITA